MDLKREILREHSRRQMLRIATYAGASPARFKALVSVYLAGPYRITQRAAWPLGTCVERDPALIVPHLKKILDFLKKPGIHDAVKRNTMRLLQFADIPHRYHGQVADFCFTFLSSKKEPVAVKVFAMSVLRDIAQTHPELKNELKLLIEDQLPYASAAFRSRGLKILKTLVDDNPHTVVKKPPTT
ncbi:MAG TPA: hypothetical protein VD816_07040 [Ohtaekwangia sp.]|nr:hypothetical protein [Ohtaekwangia sp.]